VPIVKVLVDKNLHEKTFFNEIKERLSGSDMVKNPFKASLSILPDQKKMMVFLDLEPLYPTMIPKVGGLLLTIGLIFGWISIMIAGGFLALSFIFWTDRFFYWVLKRARKKLGITGEIQLLSNKETLRGVMRLWDK